jgi:hypothetical protein
LRDLFPAAAFYRVSRGGRISIARLALLRLPSGQRCDYFTGSQGPGYASFRPAAICRPDRWNTAKNCRCSFYSAVIALGIALAACCGPAGRDGYGQDSHKSKVPGIDKITSGSSRLAFNGNVLSLDEKHELLSVNTVQGGTTEVFPVKKGVHVSAANGARLKLDTLKPGTNVLVYYEQKAEKRTVTEIIVLSPGASPEKNKPTPPS